MADGICDSCEWLLRNDYCSVNFKRFHIKKVMYDRTSKRRELLGGYLEGHVGI